MAESAGVVALQADKISAPPLATFCSHLHLYI